MKPKPATPSWSLFAILQKHSPTPAPRTQSPRKVALLVPAKSHSPVRSRIVKPRTIADIHNTMETKVGNDLYFDEFGDDFHQSSIAEDSLTDDFWAQISPKVRQAAVSPKSKGQFSAQNTGLKPAPRPDFEDIALFTTMNLVPSLFLSSTPSLNDGHFLSVSPISLRDESVPPSSSQSILIPEKQPRVDPAEIDAKLQELLAICRPLSSAVLWEQKNAEDLLTEVTDKLRYVKEERNVLKAKLILKFLSEYRKHVEGFEAETEGTLEETTVKIESSQYVYTPSSSPGKRTARVEGLSPEKLSQTKTRRRMNVTEKAVSRSKSPIGGKNGRGSPGRTRTPMRGNFPRRKEKELTKIGTPGELRARLAQ